MTAPLAAAYTAAAAAVAVYMLIGWLWSLARRDASVVDTLWGPGFALVAAAGASVSGALRAPAARQALLLAMVALWGLRLALHIHFRNRGKGEDYRYRAMRERS